MLRRRAAYPLLAFALAVACQRGPKEGGTCSAVRAQCTGTNEALFCVGSDIGKGHYRKVHCLGPAGCTTTNQGDVLCDASRTDEGTPCPETWQAKAGCSADGKAMLLCSYRKWEESGPCRGPRGCYEQGDDIRCDNSLSEPGDPCDASNEGKVACTADGSARVMCRAGKFLPSLACAGPKRCDASGASVVCDGAAGIPHGACTADGAECGADRKSIVSCKDGRFGDARPCLGVHGCEVKDERVYCDQSVGEEGAPCGEDREVSCAADGKHTVVCKGGTFAAGRGCPGACKVVGNSSGFIPSVRCY